LLFRFERVVKDQKANINSLKEKERKKKEERKKENGSQIGIWKCGKNDFIVLIFSLSK